MSKEEIIERLEEIAKHAVHVLGEKPFFMSLDDGIAIHEAIDILKSAQTDVADENLQFTEQEKEFLCMLFSLCNEMLGMKGRYMEIDYKPFGYNELFELSQKLKIDY